MDHVSRPRGNTHRDRPAIGSLLLHPLPVLSLTLLLLLTLGTLGFRQRIAESILENTASQLRTVRDLQVKKLRRWSQRELHQRLAFLDAEPQNRQYLIDLLQSADHSVADNGATWPDSGWLLLTPGLEIVAAADLGVRGESFPLPQAVWDQVRSGRTMLVPPFSLPLQTVVDHQTLPAGHPVLAAVTPLRSKGIVNGLVAVLIDADQEYARLFQGTGADGPVTFAFDRRGRLVTDTSPRTQLQAGPTADRNHRPGPRPTVDLMRSGTTTDPTQLAASATRGGTDHDVDGYTDVRGVEVVGAWTWLEDLGVGVGTEIKKETALEALTRLNTASGMLIGIVAALCFGLTILTMVNQNLKLRATLADHRARRLGNYELIETIGSGGMGTVYRGQHQLLRRSVAIKVLQAGTADAQSVRRFEREVQRTSELKHPNTVQVYDYGRTPEGVFFYVMELIEGLDLNELVQHYGAQAPGRVVFILSQVCGALAEAHARGLVHRDVKPGNLLLSATAGVYDFVKVVDFGVVKETSSIDTNAITRVESITGTPLYMSPEAIRDATRVDARADIYSLGAVGYFLLTGKGLFDADSALEICMLQMKEIPPTPSQRLGRPIPADLQALIMACLEKDPQQRPASIEQLAAGLRTCQSASHWSYDQSRQWWSEVYVKPSRGSERDSSQNHSSTVAD